jgi:hypothetical protein
LSPLDLPAAAAADAGRVTENAWAPRLVPHQGPEMADVFRRYGKAYRRQHGASLSTAQHRVMTAIELCRTAALGGHLEECDECGHQRIAYNSCRNRHCPKCQSLAQAAWLERRCSELLNTTHFHVVFTVPEPVAAIANHNKAVFYDICSARSGDVAHDRRRSQALGR